MQTKKHRCFLCQREFGSETAYEAHRVQYTYDLWRVKGQSALARIPEGEVPDSPEATKVSAGNVSHNCVNPATLDQVKEKGLWYDGLAPSQRAKVRKVHTARSDPDPSPEAAAE